MTIDPSKYQDLSGLLAEMQSPIIGNKNSEFTIQICEDLLIDEVSKLIVDSRPPRLYIFGRSGSGKSSFINALANKPVAEVGAIKPTTVDSDVYNILFLDRNTRWELVDSRGLFESAPADGDIPIETVAKLEHDLEKHNPDLLLHVMTPDQVRAGKDDFEIVRQMNDSITGGLPPRIVCLNKIDNFLPVGKSLSSEDYNKLKRNIVETLNLISEILSVPVSKSFVEGDPVKGLLFNSEEVIGAFPMYVKEEPYWNLPTIAELLCEHLPDEALLQFAQAQRRERLMRRLAQKQTIAIADAVSQLPRSQVISLNKPVVTTLQEYLVCLIGSFAGRELSVVTSDEYFEKFDLTFKNTFSALSDIAIDVALSSSGRNMENLAKQMYGLGRSAEHYFFDGEFISPNEFKSEWESESKIE